MGVRQHNLILIGYNIGAHYYDEKEWESEDSLYEKYDLNWKSKSGDVVLLSDGYSNEFFIVGKLVTVDYDCEASGLGLHVLDTESEQFKQGGREIKEFVLQHYGIEVEPKYIVMTYYT